MYFEIADKVRKRGIRTETTFSNVTYTEWRIGWVALERAHWPRHSLGYRDNNGPWVEESTHWKFTIERTYKP